MTTNGGKKTLAALLTLVLLTTSQNLYGFQTESPSGGEGNGGTEGAPMSAEQLNALLAPIALYPDPLVAQILAASTFPDQVAVADYWVQQNKNLTGSALTQAVDKQTWDPSVKALTAFPSVLDNMAKNLNWTSSLGEAYHDQPSDVMNAIQALRAQAKEKGNLKSNAQITVEQQSPQTIVIQPANPEVVYVPEYNPAVIYGVPYVTPGYTAASVAAAGVIGFGAGVAVGALMSGGGWGWGAWGCNWHGGAVVYNHNNFYGNTAWHGGYYNGGYHNGYGYHNAYNRNVNNNFNHNVNNNFNRNNLNHNADDFKRNDIGSGGRASDANSWAHNSGRSNAFSDMGGHSGGWSARADSDRGWGSMREAGFSGGRFGGGGFRGGFGGGGFHGGGFRR
jgi:Protein of unknown function (DUF3300)